MARKDRERARKRHAIERARREAGVDPAPKEERPAAKAKTATRKPAPSSGGGRSQQPLLQKAQVGDVDRKGRVYERPMLLHPKIALYIYFVVLGIGLVSLLRRDPTLQAVGYGAFAVGMLVIADSKTTWMRALPFIVLAAALAAGAVALLVIA
ncbi:MAG TPA: hypothetical protein VFX88_22580 [Actinomycetota bacterium]|nr:hypothetical protein [Actinomycetota bacterium]